MGSTFDDIAALAAPVLVEHFGERDNDGDLVHHVITLPTGVLILWPASVGELKQEELFDRGKIEVRELCILHGAAADLPAGYFPFPKQTRVLVEKWDRAGGRGSPDRPGFPGLICYASSASIASWISFSDASPIPSSDCKPSLSSP